MPEKTQRLKDKPYMLYFDQQTKERLEALAVNDRRSQAEIIRILIDRAYADMVIVLKSENVVVS